MQPLAIFPNYMQMQRRVPLRAWRFLRLISVAGAVSLCGLLFARPDAGLTIFWGFIVPLLPILFFTAPGLWRNICPLAAANQTPRVFSFTRGLTAPGWVNDYGYLIAVAAFIGIVASRKVLFNHSGPAVALLLLGAMAAAFAGGLFLKGKAGWCSSMCPLLPVQRLYGQTPFAVVRNSHCEPCVGCTKNCYDFNPYVAYMADQYEHDMTFATRRRFFAASFPGLILGFFLVPDTPTISMAEVYLRVGLYIAVSVGSFYALDALVKASPLKLTTLYAAAALNIYYWFVAPTLFARIAGLWDASAPSGAMWVARAALLAFTMVWIVRTYRREALFRGQVASTPAVQVGATGLLSARSAAEAGQPEVTFLPVDRRVVAAEGMTLLELAERDGVPIEAGCRMGMCGSDPIAVLEGMDNLSPIDSDEADTLRRLGLGDSARMACCARVRGDVRISLDISQVPGPVELPPFEFDASISTVVVVGNGTAGVTAADHIRRNHPYCEIDLVGREKHDFYNRMAISRLIYGRSAMQGLYLLPDHWYEKHRISRWINTRAIRIDRGARQVMLGVGQALTYDRLILACGSSSFVPPIEGMGLSGCFVLREADDAMHIRAFAQEHGCSSAMVAGGGILGLEAAYALVKLGLAVSVLERGPRLMARQLDDTGAALLQAYLERLGIRVLLKAQTAGVEGVARVQSIILADGYRLPCDLFLVCAGVHSNNDLAREAGLEVDRGVVVDDHLRTSDPDIFAAGDIAEFQGIIQGLWPTAVDQAKVAAINAVGGDVTYAPSAPVTMLKVVGVDLTSIGRIETGPGDEVIALADEDLNRYRKLVISDGKIAGAILLGHPLVVPGVTVAVEDGRDVSGWLDELRAGDWSPLAERVETVV
jgi:NADPH-dependent 2,4-dienoyl-CoA reductase/sulfur reductase-like enzyme/ferredoxin